MKYFKYIIILFLFSCCRYKKHAKIQYSDEFQENLLKDIEKANSQYINTIIIDFYNLNNQL